MRVLRALLLLALGAAAGARRPDLDFEFDDAADADEVAQGEGEGGEVKAAWSRARPRRYIYDPHNALCRALACAAHELCLLRAGEALCATRNHILRQGDVIVSGSGAAPADEDADDGDVFYEADPPRPAPHPDAAPPARCVGCGGWAGSEGGSGGGGGGGFLCGSDNRTYSSLCRLDLHNCVRRPAPPVALACRGFCPCRPALRPALRPATRRRPDRNPARRLHTNRDEWRRRRLEAAHNEVLPERDPPRPRPGSRPARRRTAQGGRGAGGAGGGGAGGEGGGCLLDRMADRLLDWFSVLMEEAGAAPPPTLGFPAGCKGEVRWMFAHLDADADAALSAAELYALRHDERERCLRPFLASCGGEGGGGGGGVTRGAWCRCLARAARPCSALARALRQRGGYVPACDARGYYSARQCHAALGVCWCVDAHGAELPASRTRGLPACPAPPTSPAPPNSPAPAPEDDEDAGAGSGDADLRY